MEQRISLITLGVSDLERSREFYSRLGWKLARPSEEGVAFYQAGGVVLALYPWENLARDMDMDPRARGRTAVTLAHNVREKNDVDGALDVALAAGATSVKAPHDAFWGGRVAYFADPDGFIWEIAWNPFFSFDSAGNLSIA